MSKKIKERPIEVVGITSPAMNSMMERYFIGQTGMLNLGINQLFRHQCPR